VALMFVRPGGLVFSVGFGDLVELGRGGRRFRRDRDARAQ